jgi:hypothetical protein
MISNSYRVIAESIDSDCKVSLTKNLYNGTYDQSVSFVKSFSDQIESERLDLMIYDNFTNMIIAKRTIIRESAA